VADELFSDRSAAQPLWHAVGRVDNPYYAVRLSIQGSTGWITGSWPGEGKLSNLCWLPTEKRGHSHAVYGSTMVIGADTGAITILDLGAVLGMLSHIGL
jgi:hypothetical protein